ncbi:MAG: hypothetical protein AB1679_26075 [Actinomycetota bacterium]
MSEATDRWRFEGVLDITCLYEDTNELLLPTIAERARSIEQRLLEQAPPRERALLDDSCGPPGARRGPVASLNQDVVISNAAAARRLGPVDHPRCGSTPPPSPAATTSAPAGTTARLAAGVGPRPADR